VTGAEGFIGSHLVDTLVRDGYPVRAFVLYNAFNSWGWLDHADDEIRDSIELYSGDVRDPHGVRQAVEGCEVVLHLAALIGIPYSYQSPAAYVDTNITGTLNILQAARDQACKRVVVTSTSEVYGTAQFVPITEEHPVVGQSPYAATKIGADQIALSYYRSFETPVTVLRPFNTYGPRQSARAVIPTIITQLLAGIRPIRLGSLHPTRDFSYVTDVARAFVQAIDADGAMGEVVNVGSGFEVSIGETAEMIAEVLGHDLRVAIDDGRVRPRSSEVERLFADAGKAARLLDWRPTYGGADGFRRGIGETIAWFRESPHLARYKAALYNV